MIEDAAAQLIRYRGSEVPSPESVAEIFISCEDALGDLLTAILGKFSTLATRLRTDLPLVYAKVCEIAQYDQNLDCRDAAAIIAGHRLHSTEIPELRDQGCADVLAVLDDVNARGRAPYVIISIVDVWLGLLPELNSVEGAKMLDEHLD